MEHSLFLFLSDITGAMEHLEPENDER